MRLPFKTFEYGTAPNAYDVLKAIALITMVIDHMGAYFFPETDALRVVGRIAFPVFLFLVGYSGNFRWDNWLFAGAIVVCIARFGAGNPLFPLNILFSILLWRWVMSWLTGRYELEQQLPAVWFAALVFLIPADLLVEYGTTGLMFALLGWFCRTGRKDAAVLAGWIVTAVLWALLQVTGFHMEGWFLATFLAEATLLLLLLYRFPFSLSLPHTWYNTFTLLIARNTLPIYIVHVVLFAITERMLWPERFPETVVFFNIAPPPRM